MEKKAIFTICAKNYLAQAKTLGHSVREFCPDCDFHIVLSDEVDGNSLYCDDFNLIESRSLGINGFDDMAFKYDVIEFSTAVKPFYINQLFKEGYDKVLYLDPDMVVYSSLQFLFDNLDGQDAILTPHIVKPYINYESAVSEETLLFVGIFNLGFFGIKNSETGRYITQWWMVKLKDQCFADKTDGLHVDQKWMDFLPSLYGNKVLIQHHPGVNIAFWNYHERKLFKKGGQYFVDSEEFPLAIFHFSSFDPYDMESMAKRQSKFTLTILPEYRELFTQYVKNLQANNLDHIVKLKYKYSYFDNDVPILQMHRRLYRGLVIEGMSFTDRFSTRQGSYYNLLENNKVILIDKEGEFKTLKKTFGENPPIFKKIFAGLSTFNRMFGTKKYYLMMRFFAIYHRFENQTFLIKKR